MTSQIPESLRTLKQWVCWSYEQRGEGKPTKVPLTIGGYGASSVDPADWYTYEDAVQAAARRGFAGIGFVFTSSDNFVGIDLDDCFASAGELKPWAERVLNRLAGTYSEVSPSGNGVKIWLRGKNPLDRGRKVSVDDGSIEIYDRGRFFTVTGNVWDAAEVDEKQESINWIVEEFFSTQQQELRASTGGNNFADDNRKLTAASAYLATIEPAISGSKGHDTTYRAACKMVVGFDLSIEQALHLLATEYNPRCQPPWTEKELRHKVESADKETGPRGGLLGDSAANLYPGVDISGIVGKSIGIESIKEMKIEKRPTLPDEFVMPAGLLGDMVRFIRETARYDLPEVALASSIAFAGMLLGRRVRATDDTRPNIYCLSIAESGTGKNHPRQTIKRIMYAAGIEVPREGAASATSVARMLARVPSVVMQIDEAGLVFRAMKNPRSPQAELGGLYSELFTSSNGMFSYRAYADSTNETPVDQPHLSINAVTTEQSLYTGGFTHEDIEQGLFGRFLLFRPRNMDPEERFDLEVQPIPDEIVDKVKSWWDFTPWDKVAGANLMPDHPEPMVIPFSDAAKKRYRQYATAITERMKTEDTFRKAIWRRSKEKTSRLALIHACMKAGFRETVVIDRDSMDWAIAISNYSTRGMCFDMDHSMVESTYQANVQYFLSKVPAEGIESWQLNRKLRKFRQKEREEILADLVNSGAIEIEEIPTSTKPKVVVRLGG